MRIPGGKSAAEVRSNVVQTPAEAEGTVDYLVGSYSFQLYPSQSHEGTARAVNLPTLIIGSGGAREKARPGGRGRRRRGTSSMPHP